MGNVKHGFFRAGFMLCDRCVLNARCASFVPAGECSVEGKTFDLIVTELFDQYGLEGLADEILAGRVAMNLIRIARAEAYEANVGFSNASVAWGVFIACLERNMRLFLKDLALLRIERKRVEKDDVLVDVNRLLAGGNMKRALICRRVYPIKLMPESRAVHTMRRWSLGRRRIWRVNDAEA